MMDEQVTLYYLGRSAFLWVMPSGARVLIDPYGNHPNLHWFLKPRPAVEFGQRNLIGVVEAAGDTVSAVGVQVELEDLESIHTELATQTGAILSTCLERAVEVELLSVARCTRAEFIGALTNPSCTYSFAMSPLPCRVILDLPMPLAFALLNHHPEWSRLTPDEMGRLRTPIGQVMEQLAGAWESVVPDDLGC
jgi:hypothetical protein